MKMPEYILRSLAAGLAGLFAVAALIAATPLRDIVFQTDADAAGHQIRNLGAPTNTSNAATRGWAEANFLGVDSSNTVIGPPEDALVFTNVIRTEQAFQVMSEGATVVDLPNDSPSTFGFGIFSDLVRAIIISNDISGISVDLEEGRLFDGAAQPAASWAGPTFYIHKPIEISNATNRATSLTNLFGAGKVPEAPIFRQLTNDVHLTNATTIAVSIPGLSLPVEEGRKYLIEASLYVEESVNNELRWLLNSVQATQPFVWQYTPAEGSSVRLIDAGTVVVEPEDPVTAIIFHSVFSTVGSGGDPAEVRVRDHYTNTNSVITISNGSWIMATPLPE